MLQIKSVDLNVYHENVAESRWNLKKGKENISKLIRIGKIKFEVHFDYY